MKLQLQKMYLSYLNVLVFLSLFYMNDSRACGCPVTESK